MKKAKCWTDKNVDAGREAATQYEKRLRDMPNQWRFIKFMRPFIVACLGLRSVGVLVVLAGTSVAVGYWCASHAWSKGGGPSVHFKVKTHDFGDVEADVSARTTFFFENDGDRAVAVAAVHGSCGCLITAATDKRIDPGESGEILVTLSTQSVLPPVHMHKTVVVTFSDVAIAPVNLEVTANVQREIDVEPDGLRFSGFLRSNVRFRIVRRMLPEREFESLLVEGGGS
jgi:hypothetical protein